jgi:hypothetical protein
MTVATPISSRTRRAVALEMDQIELPPDKVAQAPPVEACGEYRSHNRSRGRRFMAGLFRPEPRARLQRRGARKTVGE